MLADREMVQDFQRAGDARGQNDQFGSWYGATPITPPNRKPRILRYGLVTVVIAAVAIIFAATVGSVGVSRPADRPVTAGSPSLDEPDRCSRTHQPVLLPGMLTEVAPATGSVVITPGRAAAVAEALWSLRQNALHSCDVSTLKQIDTSSAEVGDLTRAQCNCLYTPAGAPVLESRVFLPKQTHLPAFFIAEIRTREKDGTSWEEVMAITRTSPATSWQVHLATGWAADPGKLAVLGTALTDNAGFSLPADTQARKRAARAANGLAAFWQQAKDTGTVPANPFTNTYWTSAKPARHAEHPQDTVQRNGLHGHFRYFRASSDPIFQVSETDHTLACTAIRTESIYTSAADGYPHQSNDRKNWGPALAPGTYRSISLHAVSQTCFINPHGARSRITVVGGDDQIENTATGVPLGT